MSYYINIDLTFLLIILGYKNLSTPSITCIITQTRCSWHDLVVGLGRNTEGVIALPPLNKISSRDSKQESEREKYDYTSQI